VGTTEERWRIMQKVMYYTVLEEVVTACQPGKGQLLREYMRKRTCIQEFYEARSVLASTEDTMQYLVMVRAGAGHRTALAQALGIEFFAKAYNKLAFNPDGVEDVAEATRRRRAMVVLLNAALLEDKKGIYAQMSKKARRDFIDDMLEYWVYRVR
jgi:hypothetical protein